MSKYTFEYKSVCDIRYYFIIVIFSNYLFLMHNWPTPVEQKYFILLKLKVIIRVQQN